MKLEDMMKDAIENNVDELDFFMEVLEQGFTLEDFKKIGHYDYAKRFMEEHGLLEDDVNEKE